VLQTRLTGHLQTAGYPTPDDVIHLFIGGSELHGAKVGATDDLDLYGVFVEQPEEALGLTPRPHFIWSTATDDRRNGPEDVDITLYSLRRWAHLAAKGNATALHFLFASATSVSSPAWNRIQASTGLFLAKHSADQFLGFADNQYKRIRGEAGRGKKGRRPEYECIHGYDTKAAMHCLRLYLECAELMREGHITLPRPERDLLIQVRQGHYTLEQFEELCLDLRNQAEQSALLSSLPDAIDQRLVSELIAGVHRAFWLERDAPVGTNSQSELSMQEQQ
jgi:predicted nucleotidyltransferase